MNDNDLREKTAEFLATTGLLMMGADGVRDKGELEALHKMISNFTPQPEKYVYFTDMDDLKKRAEMICAYWSKADDEDKAGPLGMLIGFALIDGKLHEGERDLLTEIANLLELDQETVDIILNEMLKFLNPVYKSADDKDIEKTLDFIGTTGLFVAMIDGKVEPIEKEGLHATLTRFTNQPDKYVFFKDDKDLIERTKSICEYWAKSDDDIKKIFLLGLLVGIAICDGELHENERGLLLKIEGLLNIEEADVVNGALRMMGK